MKRILCYICLAIITQSVYSQSPNFFNYQAIIRNNAGDLIINQDVSFKISIIKGNNPGAEVYSEIHNVSSNNYGQCNLEIGNGNNPSENFSTINWSVDKYFLKVGLDDEGGTSFQEMGIVQLLSVPYSFYSNKADSANVAKQLAEETLYFTDTDTLFAVKDREGNLVFAVFPDGAMVYVNESAKGKIGGFAVSGRNPAKATEEKYLVVTADSTRVFVNQPLIKGKIGGFAVSGRNPAKAEIEDYMVVTADSTRIYINQDETKGKIGGFAVSGRNPAKGSVDEFLDLTPDNYFIGHQSGENNTDGVYNSFYGYQTGMYNGIGSQNVFIGYQTGKLNDWGHNNNFIGNKAGYSNMSGEQNVFIGHNTGYSNIGGSTNVFIGDSVGYANRYGNNNIYLGPGSARNNKGRENIFLGEGTGYLSDSINQCIFFGWQTGMHAQGDSNIYIGIQTGGGNPINENTGTKNIAIGNGAGANINTGSYNVYIGQEVCGQNSLGTENVAIGYKAGSHPNNNSGTKNVFIGAYAGYHETSSNKLYISNSDTDKPLIGGDFEKTQVKVSHIFNINGITDYPSSPEIGDIIRLENHTDPPGLYIYNGSTWQAISTW